LVAKHVIDYRTRCRFWQHGGATVKAILPSPSCSIIPAERNFAWNPGLTSKGGIPNRTSVCATLSPGANSQAGLDSCPAGKLSS
jgi:hypothetical protein